ncbi:hypothetical protein KAU55_05660 [Candidatus Bathyarchaeota archaeon]|nr:hypothetical protein [Candidatus Bathyarchaeota archaeon]
MNPWPPAPSIVSCNQFGNDKDAFYPAEDVYAKGDGYPARAEVTIYIIPDGYSLTPANAKTVTHGTIEDNGTLATSLVWTQPLDYGRYDIWVDVNQNEVFDDGDVCNDQAVEVFAFHVIPEPIVIIGTLLMLGALATFYFKKKHFC